MYIIYSGNMLICLNFDGKEVLGERYVGVIVERG